MKVDATLDEPMVAAIDRLAADEDRTRSKMIKVLLAEALAARGVKVEAAKRKRR